MYLEGRRYVVLDLYGAIQARREVKIGRAKDTMAILARQNRTKSKLNLMIAVPLLVSQYSLFSTERCFLGLDR